jgi:hypothetical protein
VTPARDGSRVSERVGAALTTRADEKKATDEKEEKIVGESHHLWSPLDPVDVISIGRVGHPDSEDLCASARIVFGLSSYTARGSCAVERRTR